MAVSVWSIRRPVCNVDVRCEGVCHGEGVVSCTLSFVVVWTWSTVFLQQKRLQYTPPPGKGKDVKGAVLSTDITSLAINWLQRPNGVKLNTVPDGIWQLYTLQYTNLRK